MNFYRSTSVVCLTALVTAIAACGGGGGGGDDAPQVEAAPGQTPTSTKVIVLNNMTPTGFNRDGVEALSLKGKSSASGSEIDFPFATPVKPQASAIVYMNSSQCDVYWDLFPTAAASLKLLPNTGKQIFVPCGKTLSCIATIVSVDSTSIGLGVVKFGDLKCSAPQ